MDLQLTIDGREVDHSHVIKSAEVTGVQRLGLLHVDTLTGRRLDGCWERLDQVEQAASKAVRQFKTSIEIAKTSEGWQIAQPWEAVS